MLGMVSNDKEELRNNPEKGEPWASWP